MIPVTGPNATPQFRYLVILSIVTLLTWFASNSCTAASAECMAVPTWTSAELIGIPLYRTAFAFAISSYYCGVAGALMVFFGTAAPTLC